jgi:hypothetical protein
VVAEPSHGPAAAPTPRLPEDMDSGSEEELLKAAPSHLNKYFVSITGSAKKRRLHLGGECWRVPGTGYKVFEEFGESLPKPEHYHATCSQCFPSGVGLNSSASEGSSETSDSESQVEVLNDGTHECLESGSPLQS